VTRYPLLAAGPIVVLCACSSGGASGGDQGNQGTGGDDAGTAGQLSDGPATESATLPQDASQSTHDASGATDAHAGEAGDAGVAAGGSAGAGKAGADAFCAQLCTLEQRCATMGDASVDLSGCETSCQSANEVPMVTPPTPPTEKLRADYVSGLASCFATASCTGPLTGTQLAMIEANCAGTVAAGLQPTQAAAVFCHAFETSPCNPPDAGNQDCVSRIMLYSDTALNAATACFSSTSCTQVATCYDTALYTQP
jgi:hypothetical protein